MMMRQAGRPMPFLADVVRACGFVGVGTGLLWSLVRFGLGFSLLPAAVLVGVIPFVFVFAISLLLTVLSFWYSRRSEQIWLALKPVLPAVGLVVVLSLGFLQGFDVRSWWADITLVFVLVSAVLFVALRRLETRSWLRTMGGAALGGAIVAKLIGLPTLFVSWFQPTGVLADSSWGKGLIEHYLFAPGDEWISLRLVFLTAILGFGWMVALFVWAWPKLVLAWRGVLTWWRFDLFVLFLALIGSGMGMAAYGLGIHQLPAPTWFGGFVLAMSLIWFWIWQMLRRSMARFSLDSELGKQTPLTLGLLSFEDAQLAIQIAAGFSILCAAWLGWPILSLCLSLFVVTEGMMRLNQRWSGSQRLWIGAAWAGFIQLFLFMEGVVLVAGRFSFGPWIGRFLVAVWLSGALWYLTRHYGVIASRIGSGLWLIEHRFWVPGVVMVSSLVLPVVSLQTNWLLPALISGFLIGGLALFKRISSPWMQVLRAICLIVMAFWLR